MLTIFPCYAAADAALARELAGFLERGSGARVFLEEGEIRSGEDLISKVNDGRMADVVLALLSPSSSPERWPLEAWQDAFRRKPEEEGVAVLSLLCAECRFPGLLRKRDFIDVTGERLPAFRAVKRRVMRRPPESEPVFVPADAGEGPDLEPLAQAIADRPGIARVTETAAALRFANAHQNDFEEVLWLTGPASETALAGDLAALVGIDADGPHPDTLERLRRLCAKHRLLIVLDGISGNFIGDHGLSSVLHVAQELRPAPADLGADEAAMLGAMAACGPSCSLDLAAATAGLDAARAEAAVNALAAQGLVILYDARVPRYRLLCDAAAGGFAERHALAVRGVTDLAAARHAFARALAGSEWDRTRELGRRVISLATGSRRLAEAYDAIESLTAGAEAAADIETFFWCAWEQSWICEHWGRSAQAESLRAKQRRLAPDQFSLFT